MKFLYHIMFKRYIFKLDRVVKNLFCSSFFFIKKTYKRKIYKKEKTYKKRTYKKKEYTKRKNIQKEKNMI